MNIPQNMIYYYPPLCDFNHLPDYVFLLTYPANSSWFYLNSQDKREENPIKSLETQSEVPDIDQNVKIEPEQFKQSLKCYSQRKTQQKRKKPRVQSLNRNNYSNILRSFVNIVKYNIHVRQKAIKILETVGASDQVDMFLRKIKKELPKNLNYVSPMIIKHALIKDSRDSENDGKRRYLLRILLKEYLSHEGAIFLSTCFKGKRQSRLDMIQGCRMLYRQIFN